MAAGVAGLDHDGLYLADRIVAGNQVLPAGWLRVCDGVVTGLGAGGAPERNPGEPLHDLGEATVLPGFVDTHVHGGGGGAFPAATEEQTRLAVELHRAHGTRRLIASLVAAHPAELLRQVEVLADQVESGLIQGIHLEGPWISSQRCGAHDPTALRDPDPAEIARLLEAGRGTIRMVTLAPELTGGLNAVRQFAEAGVVVAIGHTDATYDQTLAAIDAGARVATHLFNAMRPINHREPGPAVALMEDPRVQVELIADGVHVHPALYRMVLERVGPFRLSLVTDAMAAAGMSDGAYRLGALGVQVTDGVATVAGTDTIAGSTATMDQLFRFVGEHHAAPGDLTFDPESVLSDDKALWYATLQTSRNPSIALGLPRLAVEVGARADDLIVLKALTR